MERLHAQIQNPAVLVAGTGLGIGIAGAALNLPALALGGWALTIGGTWVALEKRKASKSSG